MNPNAYSYGDKCQELGPMARHGPHRQEQASPKAHAGNREGQDVNVDQAMEDDLKQSPGGKGLSEKGQASKENKKNMFLLVGLFVSLMPLASLGGLVRRGLL